MVGFIKKIIVSMLCIIGLGACSDYDSPVMKALRPMPWVLDHYPRGGPEPEVFKQGWQDGCETGLASMTNAYYKAFYRFKTNEELRPNPNYYKPWQDAYTYCRHYAYGPIRESELRQKVVTAPGTEFFKPFESIFKTIFIQRVYSGEGAQNW